MHKDLLEQMLLPEFGLSDGLHETTGLYQVYYYFHETINSQVWIGNLEIDGTVIKLWVSIFNGGSITRRFEIANPDFKPEDIKEVLMKSVNSLRQFKI